MRKIKTLVGSLLCAMVLLFASFPATVKADAVCDVPELTIDVTINEDGSADIVENWKVYCRSGSYTRFYHDISTGVLPEDERFGEIRGMSVKIDGTSCAFTKDVGARPEYHYNLDTNRAGATVSAYVKGGTGVTHRFEIAYSIDEFVKKVDDSYYLFVFRFIGANFQLDVDKMTINVSAPNGCVPKVLYQSNGRNKVSGSRLTVTGASNSESMYKLRVRLDGGNIPGAKAIKGSDLSNGKEKLSVFAKYFGIIAGSSFSIGILYLIISAVARSNKVKKDLKKNGMALPGRLINELRMDYSPIELTCKFTGLHKTLTLELMSMAASRRFESRTDENGMPCIVIPKNSTGLNRQEFALWQAMTSYCRKYDVPSDESGYAVNLVAMADALKGDYDYKRALDTMAYAPIKEVLDEKDKNKELKKKVNALRLAMTHAKSLNLIPEITESELLNSFGNHEIMLYYAMSGFHGTREMPAADGYNDVYYWGYYSDSMNEADRQYDSAHGSSSDSGSGCSSCSSCSSCGGGGVD